MVVLLFLIVVLLSPLLIASGICRAGHEKIKKCLSGASFFNLAARPE